MAVFFIVLTTAAHARTIVLVYDDSGSMLGEKRCVYANYAAQLLTSLLRKDDTLTVLYMSDSDLHQLDLDRERARRSAIQQIVEKRFGGERGTSFDLLFDAADIVLKGRKGSSATYETEQDWIIVLTDAETTKDYDQREHMRKARGKVKSLAGQARILWLVTGDAVDNQAPNDWRNLAPKMVEVQPVTSKGIVGAMRQAAALITGRDEKAADAVQQDGSITFRALFPLKRITIMEQAGARSNLARVSRVMRNGAAVDSSASSFDVDSLKLVNREDHSIVIAPKGLLRARVTHIQSRDVMKSGGYEVDFNAPLAGRDIQVLLETAVYFRTLLLDENGKQTAPSGQVFSACQGTKVKIGAKFHEAGSDKPLELDPGTARDIRMVAEVGDKRMRLAFDSGSGLFLTGPLKISDQPVEFYVEGSYPGQFKQRSVVMKILGKECQTTQVHEFSSPEGAFPVPYTYSETPEKAGTIPVEVEYEQKQGAHQRTGKDVITASGLPEGVSLVIDGRRLSRDNSEIRLDPLKPGKMQIGVERDRDFKADKPVQVTLKVRSEDKYSIWKRDTAELTLAPRPRSVEIVCDPGMLDVQVDELESAGKVGVRLEADGRPLSAEELENWRLTVEEDGLVGMNVQEACSQGGWGLGVETFLPCTPCLTATGSMNVRLTAKGPFPLETATATLPVDIRPIPWWKACLGPIILVLALLLLLIWLYGVIRKPRFAHNAKIFYYKTDMDGFTKKDKKSLASNFFNRYIVPFVAERRGLFSMEFKATRSKNRILLVFDTRRSRDVRKTIRIDGTDVFDRSALEHDMMENSKLEVKNATKIVYEFVLGQKSLQR